MSESWESGTSGLYHSKYLLVSRKKLIGEGTCSRCPGRPWTTIRTSIIPRGLLWYHSHPFFFLLLLLYTMYISIPCVVVFRLYYHFFNIFIIFKASHFKCDFVLSTSTYALVANKRNPSHYFSHISCIILSSLGFIYFLCVLNLGNSTNGKIYKKRERGWK